MRPLRGLPLAVWLLGWASLFTDAATEMIYPLLPVYLSRVLGVGAVSLGVIEGVAEGVNSALKIVSGRVSDRWSRRKPIVIAGYALSSLARPFIGATTAWTQVLAIRVIDRTGKGIRGAPRDAMLAELATLTTRGRVYGFHRAMDHAGAVVGPLVATLFLLAWPGEYRTLFALTIIPGALAVWMLFRVPEASAHSVANPVAPSRRASDASLASRAAPEGPLPARGARETSEGPPVRATEDASDVLPLAARNTDDATGGPPPAPRDSERALQDRGGQPLPRRFWAVLAIILIFSLGNSADAFLLLRLSAALGHDAYIPLLWALLHVVKASLSVYGGALSDRVGRKAVIVAGWSVYAVVYVGFAMAESAAWLVTWFLVYGVYFGLTEGSEKALVADLAPASRRGTAFGFYNAALGVGALLASVAFGVLYDRLGHLVAFGTGAGLAAVAAVLLVLLRTDKRKVPLLYS